MIFLIPILVGYYAQNVKLNIKNLFISVILDFIIIHLIKYEKCEFLRLKRKFNDGNCMDCFYRKIIFV